MEWLLCRRLPSLLRPQQRLVLQPPPGRSYSSPRLNVPKSAVDVARSVGVCSMMRLPLHDSSQGLDAAFVGVPLDTGTSNRPGARFGPRHIRAESSLLRAYNGGTKAAPFESLMVADIGDVNVNLYDLKQSCKMIREAFQKITSTGCIPSPWKELQMLENRGLHKKLANLIYCIRCSRCQLIYIGGDHTITYPILQALAEKHGPVGLVHIDAHADTSDIVLGSKICHGTPFRRCVEEGLLDCKRVVQIGLRGSTYEPDGYIWGREQGFRTVTGHECWLRSLAPLMVEVRQQMGDGPVYISFDIDGLDPAFAPGTGTPEIAGLHPSQALEIIQGCRGMRIIGCDLVEVAPLYDPSGNTALTAANLLFEMLCVLPNVKYY